MLTVTFYYRYLSALNISERTGECLKSKENEIRTRARAEEKRERFKIVDNLTRVIDDVALNYSANHEGEDLPASAQEKKLNSAVTSSGIWSEGEITVKSFAKISNNAPPNQQRARKSFPTPSTSKTIVKQPMISAMRKDGTATAVAVPSSNVSKENASTSSTVSNSTTHNPVTSSTASVSTTQTVRAVPNLTSASTATSILTTAVTTTVSVPPSVPPLSLPSSVPALVPSCSLLTKPQETISGSTLPHVILFPNPTMNYGGQIVNPVLGMVSTMKIWRFVVSVKQKYLKCLVHFVHNTF